MNALIVMMKWGLSLESKRYIVHRRIPTHLTPIYDKSGNLRLKFDYCWSDNEWIEDRWAVDAMEPEMFAGLVKAVSKLYGGEPNAEK